MNDMDGMEYQEVYEYMLNSLDSSAESLTDVARQLEQIGQKTEELMEDLDESTEHIRPILLRARQQTELTIEATLRAASHSLPGKELAEFNRVVEPLRAENDEFTQIVNHDNERPEA